MAEPDRRLAHSPPDHPDIVVDIAGRPAAAAWSMRCRLGSIHPRVLGVRALNEKALELLAVDALKLVLQAD